MPPATYTPKVTARAHPQVIRSQSPEARKIVVGSAARPEEFRAATAIATTPSPNMIRMNVPRNCASNSPQMVARHPVLPRVVGLAIECSFLHPPGGGGDQPR